MILAVLDDLMFSSKIKTTASQLGVTVTFARSADAALNEMRKSPPSLVILDLNNPRTTPLAIVASMKADPALASVPTLGYVSHVDTATINAAREAGGGEILARSAATPRRRLPAAADAFPLPLVVFPPADAPQTKLAAIRRHGADLHAEGRDYDHAEVLAKKFASDAGAAFISPYNDPDVIAGAATVALEILEDAPDTDMWIVPIGGGGLISGVATAAKSIAQTHTVIGVEVEASCAFQTSVRAGTMVHIVPGPTIADGLGGNSDPETITFGFIQRFVDRIVTVSEADLKSAVLGLVEAEHLIAEAAGAAGIAALIGRRIEEVRDRHVVVIVTGSNIDRARLASLLS